MLRPLLRGFAASGLRPVFCRRSGSRRSGRARPPGRYRRWQWGPSCSPRLLNRYSNLDTACR